MSLTDELERLAALHAQGRLTDEEYARAKAKAIEGGEDSKAVAAVNSLRRSRGDQWIAGVCGGIAAASGIESWIWRLAFAVLALFGGTGVLLYILLWIFVPEE
jgi:phage shock protein C